MNFEPDYELELAHAKPIAKFLVRFLVCPTHKTKLRVDCDFDRFGVNAYVSKCCCGDMEKVVFTLLNNTQLFQKIQIKYIDSRTVVYGSSDDSATSE